MNALTQNKCELESKGMAVIPMTPIQEEGSLSVDFYGIEIGFNGHKRILQIDTGASGFLLTHSAATGLGLVKVDTSRIHGFGEQGANSATVSNSPTVQIGGLVDALGGMKDRDSVVIDRFVPASMKSWSNIYRRGHMLIIPTRVNAQPPRLFVLDTGAISNLIDKKFAAKVSTLRDSINQFQGLSGAVKKVSKTGPLTLDFANLRLPVSGMDSIDIVANQPGISGFLGYPTLSQLVMHIDYRDNLVMLEAPLAHKH